MNQAKSVAYGFVAMESAICLFVISGWPTFHLNVWAGFALFFFLAASFSFCFLFFLKGLTQKSPVQMVVKDAKNVLMALQGAGFACWFFDVISTVFAININQVSSELNPLGWPLSVAGGLFYYIPVMFIVYYLLYKVKSKESFYVSLVIMIVTLFMGARNLNAGLNNFTSANSFASSTAELEAQSIWIAIVLTLGILNISIVTGKKSLFRFKKSHIFQQK